MTDDFPHASVLEGIRFTAEVGLPNVIQGLFNKRELPTKVVSRLGTDHLGYRLVEEMVKSYGSGPFFVRVAKDEALLVHHPDDLKFVLGGSPDPFASDPEPKLKGMSAFQPDALTISRGDLWTQRRQFADAVLEPGKPLHSMAKSFVKVAADTAKELTGVAVDYHTIDRAFQRMTRRVVFGDHAADDTRLMDVLGELMSQGNKMPGEPGPQYPELIGIIEGHLDKAEPGSLAAEIAKTPAPPGGAAGQVIHWLFAMGDTLAANTLRALAALATHPEQQAEVRTEIGAADIGTPKGVGSLKYLAGCLLEAMRLWPTTGLFARVATRDIEFPNGAVLPEGHQVLIYNVFNHRNRARIPYADRFSPGEWVTGTAGDDWSYNFMSHGPQGCPGYGLSVFLGQAVMAHLISAGTLAVNGARLDPAKSLPHSLDLFGFTVEVTPAT
ncbi:MAG: cytochrome P450 [Actinomycetia bacterium]|nr:cytochrome P450 [Actinomycetes bacterium]